MFASLNGEVNFYAELTKYGYLEKLPKKRKESAFSRYYMNALAAFDIETTTINLPIEDGKEQNAHAFMYIWQFQLNDKTIIGRTWEDFSYLLISLTDALEHIKKDYNMSEKPYLVCWVHNLAFEFTYLSSLYPFTNEECFFRDIRKPIYCRMFNCIEYRCSYIQTNMSLKKLTEEMGVEEKLSGQMFDYTKTRYPWTPLTDYELEYCVRDVRSLVECMRIKMEREGDTFQTIPLTSTGYVRRDCVLALRPYYLKIKEILPTLQQFRLLRKAFRGGNTHCNRAYSTKIIDDVYSYDMTSCYPAQQLTKKFPMTKFQWINDRLTVERIQNFIGLGYAVVGLYHFSGLRLKNKKEPIPYISLARTEAIGFKTDNGRVLEADKIELALTEIDLGIVLEQYTYDSFDVKAAMVAQKHYLPEEYRSVIRKYYTDKTRLKPMPGEEPDYLYGASKSRVNAIFGMCCQSPLHSDIEYIDGKYKVSGYGEDDNHLTPEEIAKAEKKLRMAKFPYQWGVYTTSYARLALHNAIKKAGERMLYCDTDSVKTVGPLDLTEINNARQQLAETNKAYADDRYGIRHYMGVFELDGHYKRFISCGAKRYAFEKEKNGKVIITVTVAGVSKAVNEKTGIPFAVEELGKLENFKAGHYEIQNRKRVFVEGMVWHEAAGVMAIYNDEDDFYYTDPESGQQVYIGKNVAMIPTTYEMTLSKDYYLLLKEIDLYGEYKRRRD